MRHLLLAGLLLSTFACARPVLRGMARSEPTETFPHAWGQAPQTAPPRVVPASLDTPAEFSGGLMAVLPLDTANAALDPATRLALEEAIRTVAGEALVSYGYTVLTGDTTLALLSDNGIDPDRACEASCALDAARELQAQVFISGTVTRTEGEYVAFVRLFESSTGRQLSSLSLEGETVRALRQAFARRADEFFGRALRRMR